MLKAFDTSGNVSDMVGQRTTVATLPNVELIKDIDDRKNGWTGNKTNLEATAVFKDLFMSDWAKLSDVHYLSEKNGIVSDLHSAGTWGSVIKEGTYTFADVVDLGGVYEVRVSSMIKVHAQDQNGKVASAELWDAWVEYRVTGSIRFMSDWTTLAAEPDLSGAGAGNWSEWRIINVGDITGKLIQFRIQTRTFDPNVKVFITDGSVIIDAVDRVWSKQDITIPAATTHINFDPAYMFDEIAVAISIDGNNHPLMANVTNKTKTGFDVTLYNAVTNTVASGQIDVLARGQGLARPISI
jgi:hypothetical protein